MKISRLNSIEQYVISKETVSIDELCEVFGVSKNTIRRDLNDLEARGHIAKVYGGVTIVGSPGAVPMPVRSNLNSSDKNQIGMLAANEVQDGDTIFIDSGSTTVCLLRYLSSRKRVTVITHSLGAMSKASKYDNLSLISLGGIYNAATDSFTGLSTFEMLSGMTINKAFMAATGISLESGMTNTTFLEAEIKRGVVQPFQAVSISWQTPPSLINPQSFPSARSRILPHLLQTGVPLRNICNSSLKTIFVFVTTTEFLSSAAH